MSNATICPVILICNETTSPEVFNKDYMLVAAQHIKFCDDLHLDLQICKEILRIIMDLFPWEQGEDLSWRRYLHDWWNGVISKLEQHSIRQNLSSNQKDNSRRSFLCEINSHPRLLNLFHDWLYNWKTGYRYKRCYVKGIGVNNYCNTVASQLRNSCICSEFQIIVVDTEWKCIKYPWLLLYDSKLPVEGEFPFQPQNNWMHLPQAPKGSSFGYLDRSRNEWCWDHIHQDHWDVQISRSSCHKRVSPAGQIV